jgi:hypothetical protein
VNSLEDSKLAESLWANVTSAISQVADREYQERIWLGDVADERSSFVEVYYLIEGSDIDVIRAHREALRIANKEWELTLRFLVRFLTYYAEVNDVYAQEDIVKDPDWAVVVASARDVLDWQAEMDKV